MVQTTVKTSIGQDTTWNEEFQVDRTEELCFVVYEKDPLSDDLIG